MAVLSRRRKPKKDAVLTLQVSADTMRKLGSIKRYKGRRIGGKLHIEIDGMWHSVSEK